MTYGSEDRSKPLTRVMMRAPGPALAHADPAAWHYGPGFNPRRAAAEHAELARIVAASGAEIHWIPSENDGLADAVFVQDPSFVTRAGAVVLNMGKALRRPEPALHVAAYAALGVPVIGQLTGEATVESGDCVWIDPDTLAIGRGARSNQAGIDAVAALLAPQGIAWSAMTCPTGPGPAACLHLMSLISPLAPKMALIHAPLMPYALWSDLARAAGPCCTRRPMNSRPRTACP